MSDNHMDPDVLARLHRRLSRVRVRLSPEPDASSLRRLFSEIRAHRTLVHKISCKLSPISASLKARLIRIDRAIEHKSSKILETKKGLLGTANDRERQARIRVILADEYDLRASTKEEIVLLDEMLAQVRNVREELKLAFDEASRSLSSLEFEYRVERSQP